MHTVTDAFHAACSAPGREITSKINFNGTTDLPASEVQEIVVTEQFGSSDGVTIGAAFSSSCKVTFYKQDNLPLNGAFFIPSVKSICFPDIIIFIRTSPFSYTSINIYTLFLYSIYLL